MRQAGSDRPVGRPPILTEEHRKFMANWADENAESVTLNDMMEVLTNKFGKIEISKTALYNFVREKCRITWKKAHFESVDRNCTEKLDERYDWVKKWIESDLLDYESNCIFIDKASFHINSKRNFSWSRKGARARVKIPKTRAPTHTILGATCTHGVVNICIETIMVLSDKISNQSVNAVTQRPQAPEPTTKLKNMPWSQVVARKRTSLMNATFENNIHNSQQGKVIYSKVWRVGRSPGSVLLDMTDKSESPVQLMALIAKQFPSRIAVATTKEGSRKVAEINFDPLDPAIDQILKDGITFENDAVRLLPCRALDPAVPLVRLRLSNLPFLKEDILKEQLKMSLEPYGSVLDLGILRESHTGTYMGTGYAILSVPKNDDRFSPLFHHLPWYQSEDEDFYAVWSDMPTYCRYCHAEGHASLIVQRNVHPVFVGTVVLVAILLLNVQKARISHLKRPGKLLMLHRTE
ncbi:hypothetical protein G6F26_012618 [Rhizopus arrhizus]|nr:hypothetical protein G6F26_012618 [Rhizopus arrhizus]KAG1325110.1 hypothetical protein G6F63_012299 [Rhizopus arrhizus]